MADRQQEPLKKLPLPEVEPAAEIELSNLELEAFVAAHPEVEEADAADFDLRTQQNRPPQLLSAEQIVELMECLPLHIDKELIMSGPTIGGLRITVSSPRRLAPGDGLNSAVTIYFLDPISQEPCELLCPSNFALVLKGSDGDRIVGKKGPASNLTWFRDMSPSQAYDLHLEKVGT